MLGREDDYFRALERGHRAHLDAGETMRAARCSFWVGINLARLGEIGRASGWLGRAQRLVERHEEDCVEQGYLLLPLTFEHEAAANWAEAGATAAAAVEIAERFGDQDLFALAAHEQGHVLIKDGKVGTGLGLLDEAMVAAATGELSPIVTGIVYCGVILACQDAYELGRAREWTAVLSRWCEEQPDLVAFTGRCRVHRAEIMQMQGAWADALEETRRASERSTQAMNREAAGEASYRRGEVQRLRGEFAPAEAAYREAAHHGREPQPGLALLRLAEGKRNAAAAAIRRAVAETGAAPNRANLLFAQVEIMLAVGDLDEARAGA
jgi:tetratricopeptide (TPR) repeat protein